MTCDGVLGVEKLLGFKMSGSDGQCSERGLSHTLSMASLVGVIYTLLSSTQTAVLPHHSFLSQAGL